MLRLNLCIHTMAGHSYESFKCINPIGVALQTVMPEKVLLDCYYDFISYEEMWEYYIVYGDYFLYGL